MFEIINKSRLIEEEEIVVNKQMATILKPGKIYEFSKPTSWIAERYLPEELGKYREIFIPRAWLTLKSAEYVIFIEKQEKHFFKHFIKDRPCFLAFFLKPAQIKY